MTHPITVTVGPTRPAFTDPDACPAYAAPLVPPTGDDGPTWADTDTYVNEHRSPADSAWDSGPVVRSASRAAQGIRALHAYRARSGNYPASALADVLADLRHAADALGEDYADLDATADRRYIEEAVRGEL